MTFERLIERDRPYLLNYALGLTRGNRDEAEEIVQAATVKMYVAFPTFHGKCSFATWGMSIIKNTLIDQLRQQDRHKNVSLDAAIFVTDGACDPHDVAEELAHVISTLNSAQRKALRLWMSGMTATEYARAMNITVSAAKDHINRAKMRLRRHFNQPEGGHRKNARS